eukprot:COSAG02_NODE_35427_length_468_cov_1.205962_1_plen_26_part_10
MRRIRRAINAAAQAAASRQGSGGYRQ